jgi:hypothetical protein
MALAHTTIQWVYMASVSIALLLCLTVIPVLGQSKYTGPMRFSTFEPCSGNSPICAPRIFAEGVIEPDTAKKFAAFLSNTKSHQDELPPQPTVCFNSPGGDLGGGLELGRSIRQRKFQTCLAPEYSRENRRTGQEEIIAKDVVCASACAFAFVGGVNRFIEDGARYGIHQFNNPRGDQGDSATQKAVVILAEYLEAMGVSREMLDRASRSSQISWLSQAELRKFRVDNLIASEAQWKLNALNDGTVTAEITRIKPEFQTKVSLIIMKREGRPVLIIAFTPKKRNPRQLEDVLEALNVDLQDAVVLRVDDRPIATYNKSRWRAISTDVVATILPLSVRAVQALQMGKALDITVFVPNAYRDYDPSLEFPLNDLGHFLRAVLK